MIQPRNGEATQHRLLDAALNLYAQRGYAGTCLDAILKAASSSKGAFYHHFDSKEVLTAQATERHWSYVIELLNASWQRQADRDKKLDALLADLKEAYYLRKGGCPLGLLGFESRSLPPQVQDALMRGLERWTAAVAAMLKDLGIESRKEARDLAQQLFVMFEGGILLERMSGLSTALELALAAWQREVTRALEAPARTGPPSESSPARPCPKS